jgi:hypothetical protein
MPREMLEREITALSSQIHAATCRWLELVAEYDEREGWAQWGCRSCAHWVSWQCGVAPGPAREHVRVARRLRELPLIRAAFAEGELSYSKARALTRVEAVEREQELLELARHATASQLERLVRAYRGVAAAEQEAAGGRHERWLTWDYDDAGCLLLRGRLPAEEGALVVAAREAARERMANERVPAGTSTPDGVPAGTSDRTAGAATAAEPGAGEPTVGEARADALVALADASLAGEAGSRTGDDRCQVVVHVDAATLEGEGAGERCELADGAPLAAETARRLACDASIVRLLERDDAPLRLGRKTRSIPPALRRALAARDRGCRFPGCTARRFVDAHHIEHWARGGATDLDNLVLLCRRHHRLVHEGGYTVTRRSGGAIAFHRPDGRRIPACPSRAGGRPTALAPTRRPDACVSLWAGERLDLHLGVQAMLALAPIGTGEPPGI